MNVSLCLFLFIPLVSSWNHNPEQQEKIEKYASACREEVKVSQETINHHLSKSRNIDDIKVIEFLTCFGKKLGALTEDGEVDKEFVLKRARMVADEEKAQEVVKKCVVIKSNLGQTLHDASKCLSRNLPNITAVD